jgi:hypothetical protein
MAKIGKAEPYAGHSGPVKIGKSINAPTNPTGGKTLTKVNPCK